MLRTVIVLPDGTELSSGGHAINAVRSVTLTECVNSGEELTLGSACTNALEVTLFTPKGGLALAAGTEVTVYKEDPTGYRKPVGIFILEKPTRPSANTMKLAGYDRVSKLDKDLTEWLSGLAGWPYTLTTFARMVCEEGCGIPFKTSNVPNGDFPVQQFSRTSVTGRQIMRWLGEICARFCRASADGEIEFAWYTESGKTITATGDPYYFQNGLTYEDFNTAPVDAVQLRLADSEDGALWPAAEKDANSYIITGNPILNAKISSELEVTLAAIKAELADVTYTPCKVEVPANMDIRAGNTVKITDKNGKTVTAYIMTKTQTGQKDVLECTGSHRRDSSTVMNNQEKPPDQAALDAFRGLTQAQIFNKLTDNGKIQGIYAQDGVWYVNAAVAKVVNLSAESIDSTNLKVAAANITGTLTAAQVDATNLKVSAANITGTITAGKITVKDSDGATLLSAGDNAVQIAGWKADSNSLYSGSSFSSAECFLCTGSTEKFNIGNSGSIPGWMIKAGSKFGVTKAGAVWCSDIHATGGTIGDWTIQDGGLSSGSLPPPWAASSEDAETITIKKWGVFRAYYDSYEGDDHSEYAYWSWIISAAREWAEAHGLT